MKNRPTRDDVACLGLDEELGIDGNTETSLHRVKVVYGAPQHLFVEQGHLEARERGSREIHWRQVDRQQRRLSLQHKTLLLC